MPVQLLSETENGLRVCAASARLSTKEGTAISTFEASLGDEKDVKLVGKVLSSGHKSILEHHSASFAFTDVPVTVEQFLIEHRLASFTVKSRRYVNYGGMGYYMPNLPEDAEKAYKAHMDFLFQTYGELVKRGVPMEDARFVLPYCFYTNFYATANVREWLHIACDMLYGRGRLLPELAEAARPIQAWLEARYPGALEAERAALQPSTPVAPSCESVGEAHVVKGDIEILAMSNYRPEGDVARYITDARPRALEMMQYVFRAEHISLAAVTHFARHRMQSPDFPDVAEVLKSNGHILPESISGNAEAKALYEEAFAKNRIAAETFIGHNCLRFFALAGNTASFPFAMNARELLLFMRLRACNRAQWEIRAVAQELLKKLRERDPELFYGYGAACYVTGRCPEGRLSCGRPYRRENAE
ncbi:MAG: FAD-dependent thymidylate synthase [Christensenellales bacterium]